MAHSNQWDFGCRISELGGVIRWPTQMGVTFSAILVNCAGYLSGLLRWVTFWVQYW